MKWTIRAARPDDLPQLLSLYAYLHTAPPGQADDGNIAAAWREICADSRQTILLGCVDGAPVASLTVVIIPNLTHDARPYALVENVVTHADFRAKGYGTALLDAACALARRKNCYKVMLMTSRRDEKTLRFYENAGFDPADKRAFALRLEDTGGK